MAALMASAEAYAAATLPRSIKRGDTVWCLLAPGGVWKVHKLGRVASVTAVGPVVAGEQLAWSQCPLFLSEDVAREWATANPIELPGVNERVEK